MSAEEIQYYFKTDKHPESKNPKGKYDTKKLQDFYETTTEEIKRKIQYVVLSTTHSKEGLFHRWVSVSTFGNIFSDYKIPAETKWNAIIGSGYTKLFQTIKQEYYCVVLSKYLPHNTKELSIGNNNKILIINIDYFKKFAKVITKDNFVSLFLYKFDKPEIENIIRAWLIERPQEFKLIQDAYQVTIPDVATILEKFKISSLDELSEFLRNTTNILKSKIEENLSLFKERLAKFKKLIDDESSIQNDENKVSNLENQLRDFIRINPWLIDFTYNDKDVDTKTDEFVDVLLVGSYLSYKRGLLIELKRPDAETIKKYRDKDALTAAISNAISQLIHYTRRINAKGVMEHNNEPELFLEGMIIIGNNMSEYLQIFNQFLHNVKVKTFREIYEDAYRRLENFEKGPQILI